MDEWMDAFASMKWPRGLAVWAAHVVCQLIALLPGQGALQATARRPWSSLAWRPVQPSRLEAGEAVCRGRVKHECSIETAR